MQCLCILICVLVTIAEQLEMVGINLINDDDQREHISRVSQSLRAPVKSNRVDPSKFNLLAVRIAASVNKKTHQYTAF